MIYIKHRKIVTIKAHYLSTATIKYWPMKNNKSHLKYIEESTMIIIMRRVENCSLLLEAEIVKVIGLLVFK